MKKVKVPASTPTKAGPETVSAAPNKGMMEDAQPVGNAENTASGNEGMPSSVMGGDTLHEQFQPATADVHPVRMRHNKPEGGSHTTSMPTPMYAPGERNRGMVDAAKVKKFTRGGEDRMAHFKTSPRDWNTANDGSKH